MMDDKMKSSLVKEIRGSCYLSVMIDGDTDEQKMRNTTTTNTRNYNIALP